MVGLVKHLSLMSVLKSSAMRVCDTVPVPTSLVVMVYYCTAVKPTASFGYLRYLGSVLGSILRVGKLPPTLPSQLYKTSIKPSPDGRAIEQDQVAGTCMDNPLSSTHVKRISQTTREKMRSVLLMHL